MTSPDASRRRMLAAGLGAGTLAVTAAGPAATARPQCLGLPVLAPGSDWAKNLARTPQVQLAPGATYVLDRTAELPSGCLIVGNGATVTVANDDTTAPAATRVTDVTVSGVGSGAGPTTRSTPRPNSPTSASGSPAAPTSG